MISSRLIPAGRARPYGRDRARVSAEQREPEHVPGLAVSQQKDNRLVGHGVLIGFCASESLGRDRGNGSSGFRRVVFFLFQLVGRRGLVKRREDGVAMRANEIRAPMAGGCVGRHHVYL
jgi:hypothetical protein